MTSAARALLLLLLPTLTIAACGDDATTNTSSTGPAGGGSGGGSAGGVGGSVAGGSGGSAGPGTGGAEAAGAAGASGGSTAPTCDGSQQPAGTATFCFGPDGKSDTVERHEFEGGDFQVECPALVRDAGSACPASAAPCGYGFCGTFGKPYGAASLVGDRCCFSMVKCSGPNACGRPLFLHDVPVLAALVASTTWA